MYRSKPSLLLNIFFFFFLQNPHVSCIYCKIKFVSVPGVADGGGPELVSSVINNMKIDNLFPTVTDPWSG